MIARFWPIDFNSKTAMTLQFFPRVAAAAGAGKKRLLRKEKTALERKDCFGERKDVFTVKTGEIISF